MNLEQIAAAELAEGNYVVNHGTIQAKRVSGYVVTVEFSTHTTTFTEFSPVFIYPRNNSFKMGFNND